MGESSIRFEALLRAVIDAPAGTEEEVLATCEDPALRQRVRELLAAEGNGETLLSRTVERAAWMPATAAGGPPAPGSEIRPVASGRGESTKIRRRLDFVGRVVGLVGCLVCVSLAFFGLWRSRSLWQLRTELGVALLLAAMGLVISVLARRVPERWLAPLGHGALWVLSAVLGACHGLVEVHLYGVVTPLGPYLILIILWPLVHGVPLRLSVASSTVAAALALVALVVVTEARSSGALRSLPELVGGSVLGVILAGLLARRVLRARSELEQAQGLGSYLLEEKLGEGGMGEVWRASHQLLSRPTAIKLVSPGLDQESPRERARLVERFRREARVTASLRSFHTVDLYDFGVTDEGTLFIAMELIDGIDLQTLVEVFGPQPPERVRHVLLQACDSLAEAHDRGLVHRDVKPANLMLSRQGRRHDVVKVLDFGIVTFVAGVAGETVGSAPFLGTPAYMAPEMVEGRAFGPRVDLYGLGCVAYWLLTGRRVFEGASPLALMAAHRNAEVEPPSRWTPGIPPDLEAVVLRCLAKNPAERFPTADALARRLSATTQVAAWSQSQAETWWREHFAQGFSHDSESTLPTLSG